MFRFALVLTYITYSLTFNDVWFYREHRLYARNKHFGLRLSNMVGPPDDESNLAGPAEAVREWCGKNGRNS